MVPECLINDDSIRFSVSLSLREIYCVRFAGSDVGPSFILSRSDTQLPTKGQKGKDDAVRTLPLPLPRVSPWCGHEEPLVGQSPRARSSLSLLKFRGLERESRLFRLCGDAERAGCTREHARPWDFLLARASTAALRLRNVDHVRAHFSERSETAPGRRNRRLLRSAFPPLLYVRFIYSAES